VKSLKFVTSYSYLHNPDIRGLAEEASRLDSLILLDDEALHSKEPAAQKIVQSLSDLDDSQFIYILVVPHSINSFPPTNLTALRIYERHSGDWASDSSAVVVDYFSQVGPLLSMQSYPGMHMLLDSYGQSQQTFSERILDKYRGTLEAIEKSKTAIVFGAQRLGEFVVENLKASGINVAAIVDNGKSKHGSFVVGIPVIQLSEVNDLNVPIVIATTRFSKSISVQLEEGGYKNYLPYPVMSLINAELYPHEIPYVGIQEDFSKNIARHLGLFLSLTDDKSRQVHDGLIQYRLNYDARFADAVADQYERQYFDKDLIKYSPENVFVDLGGYDGDTVEKYIEFGNGIYKKIYLFEPDENILNRAKIRLKNYVDIEYMQTGAYSKDGELRFSASGRTNGFFNESGELVIPVRKLDSVVSEDPALIKMDIEGSEKDALLGAVNTIKRAKPKLAIAAYHYAHDLWRLVDVIREINPEYKFYLRHYSETGLESVIYAI